MLKNDKVKRTMLIVFGFMAFFASLIQNIYTPIIPQLQSDFNVSLLWVNTTVGGFIFIVAIMQIILGKYIDSKNPKSMLLIAIGITLLGSIACTMTNTFIIFAIFRLLQAIGCGMIPLIVITLLADLSSDDNRSSMMSNYQIILSCAPALAPILGGLIGNDYGYKGIFLVLTAVSIILLIVTIFIKIPEVNKYNKPKNSVKYVSFFKSKSYNIMISFGFLIFFTYFALLVYLPILLTRIYNISTALTGFLFLPITVSIILGSFTYKKLAKNVSNTVVFKLTMIIFPILLILFSILNQTNIYILSINIFLIGLIVGIIPALISTNLSSEFPNKKGAALGAFNFIRYTGMALGSIAVGLFNIYNVSILFVAIAILLLILASVYFLSKRQHKLITNKAYNS
ncbi:MFS transporter [Staphylococcus succinus]|nr:MULTISPECIES: MFS transporter [Staphylococcus]MDH9162434.1 MFS transporter [Staphylococcus succinus]MEB8124492.1 MFS transporter [Staphylococcus succinus]OIJ30672.1 MFS transporter [Staphylococcus sp. LCT-H4]